MMMARKIYQARGFCHKRTQAKAICRSEDQASMALPASLFAFGVMLFALALFVLPTSAFAQGATGTGVADASGQTRAMMDRLRRLEETLDTLQRAVYAGTPLPEPQNLAPAPTAPVAAAPAQGVIQAEAELLFDRVLTLEEESRALTGHYEVLEHKMDTMIKRLDRLVVDLDFRLRTIEDTLRNQNQVVASTDPSQSQAQPLEGAGNIQEFEPGAVRPLGTVTQDQLDQVGAPGSAAQPQTAALLPEGASVSDRYAAAMEFVRQQRFIDAERALDEFLVAHPNDPLASNAHYWKAEAIYARQDFERAAAVFLDGYQAFPEGSKAPDMLLKLVMSLRALGETEQACAVLGQLGSAFPDAPAKIERRASNEGERLGCGVAAN